MYFLTDTISTDYKLHAKPSFESDELFKQSICSDIIKISNKLQYGFSIYTGDSDDDEFELLTVVVDSFNIRGYILKSTLDKCMMVYNTTILTPLIWLVDTNRTLYAFTADCEEYKTAVANNYRYIDVNEIPLYSKIITTDGEELYLMAKHGIDIDGMVFNDQDEPCIITYSLEHDNIYALDNPIDTISNIIYFDETDKLPKNKIDELSNYYIDLSLGCAVIHVENKLTKSINKNCQKKWDIYSVEHDGSSYYVYYIPELKSHFISVGSVIYSVDIKPSYTTTNDNIFVLQKSEKPSMTYAQFAKYDKQLQSYSIKSIEYK